MFGLPPSVRIYFATDLTDMRKGIDGLRCIVEGALRHDPYAGHLFVFVGKSKDKVKILFWDRSGCVKPCAWNEARTRDGDRSSSCFERDLRLAGRGPLNVHHGFHDPCGGKLAERTLRHRIA